jgi:hypothetical protein
MGLKGLKRQDKLVEDTDQLANQFIKGASERVADLSPHAPASSGRERVYQRYTFSLNESVNEQIDQLTLAPRDFRANRSDVIKAALVALSSLSEVEQINLIRQVKEID